jgi:uncharacterized protein with PIN domain
LVEVLRRFDLLRSISPFQRCLRCNEPLVTVDRSEVEPRLPERIRDQHTDFIWKGSHHRHMQQLIAELSRELAADGNFA